MVTIGDCEICGGRCRTGSTKCYSCEQEERKDERASRKVNVVRQAMKVTPKRAGQLNEYRHLSKEYLEAYPCCEVEGCHAKSVEVHHMGGRQNEDLTNTDLFLAVCKVHHHEITVNSKWAIENGYSVMRTGNVEK
jgi:hypothetical protein